MNRFQKTRAFRLAIRTLLLALILLALPAIHPAKASLPVWLSAPIDVACQCSSNAAAATGAGLLYLLTYWF